MPQLDFYTFLTVIFWCFVGISLFYLVVTHKIFVEIYYLKRLQKFFADFNAKRNEEIKLHTKNIKDTAIKTSKSLRNKFFS